MSSPQPTKRKITRRRFLGGVAAVGVGAIGSWEWANHVEPFWTETTRIDIALPNLPRAFDGFQIAQISDIHIENGEMKTHFPLICDRVTALNADCIVITGDFITYPSGGSQDYFARTLPLLKARGGVFGVRGNHDVRKDEDLKICNVRTAMLDGGVRELFNEVHVFERGGQRLHLAGVDDPWLGETDFERVQSAIPKDEAAVLLAHEPDVAAFYTLDKSFGLMLSGHSHGGQICLPGGIPVRVPPMSELFPRGLYRTGQMWHYTNRGLGTVGPAMRFCSRPEISLFTLRCAAA